MTATIERRQTSQLRRAQAATGYLFVLPATVLYLTFVIAPVIVTTILAFAYYDPMLGSQWVGFDNFIRFFTDQRSLQILWNTLRFALFAVTFNVSIGLVLALALNRAMNLLTGRIARIGGLVGITLEDGTHIPLPGRQVDLPDGAPVTFGVRPEHCEIGQGGLEITVGDTEILGSETIIHAETATGNGFTVALRGISRAASGSRIPIVIREPFVHLFNEAGVTIGSDGDWRDAYLN